MVPTVRERVKSEETGSGIQNTRASVNFSGLYLFRVSLTQVDLCSELEGQQVRV